jgi:hypothetical protein
MFWAMMSGWRVAMPPYLDGVVDRIVVPGFRVDPWRCHHGRRGHKVAASMRVPTVCALSFLGTLAASCAALSDRAAARRALILKSRNSHG